MLKHNKKRNVGLLNEFFARYIAKAIIEHRDNDLKKARLLFHKHFNRGTDLYKELKLFNSLHETKVNTKEAAYSLIQQVKEACKLQSQQKLDLEKTALLHEINTHLADPDFFNRSVIDFKSYATVQVLLNDWRSGVLTENLEEKTILEEKLVRHILASQETLSENLNVLNMTNTDVDSLVINIMTEKLNSKYNALLTEDQKKILKLYLFSDTNEKNKKELSGILEGIRFRTLGLIEKTVYQNNFSRKLNESTEIDDVVTGKLGEVKTLLEGTYSDTANLSDDMVTFYMSVCNLEKELRDDNE